MKVYKENKSTKAETIKPVDEAELKDRGIVKSPTNPSSFEKIPDDVKEIIAIDSLELGVRKAAEIHGIGKTTANRITNNSEAKVAMTATKFQISNLATAKLMQTLGMIDPGNVEKETDRVQIMTGLAKVLNFIDDGKDKGKEGRSVHLHLYAPNQKSEAEYDVIEVGGVVS